MKSCKTQLHYKKKTYLHKVCEKNGTSPFSKNSRQYFLNIENKAYRKLEQDQMYPLQKYNATQ